MKREDLKKLLGESATDETIDKIMSMNGSDIEAHKTKAIDLQKLLDVANGQLTEAGKTIEGFKALKPDELKAAADDYKAKWEQAQTEHAAELLKIKQNTALEKQLKETFKVKDSELVAVKARIKADAIKFNEADETFVGLKEQIDPLKEPHPYYFTDGKEPPRIVTGGSNQVSPDKGTFAGAIQERLSQGK